MEWEDIAEIKPIPHRPLCGWCHLPFEPTPPIYRLTVGEGDEQPVCHACVEEIKRMPNYVPRSDV